MAVSPLALHLLLGCLIIPTVILLLALFLAWFRGQRDMTPLPPRVVSTVVLLCIFLSWLLTGLQILFNLF